MPDWRLTEEEMKNIALGWEGLNQEETGMGLRECIALTAQQKLAKWGDELCEEHSMPQFRRQCGICWQALCTELGVK